MLSKNVSSRLLKRHIYYTIASSIATIASPYIYADDKAPALEAEFDSAFLIGDAQKIDISRFKYGNPVLPGEYNIDVYVNGQWFGKRRMNFRSTEQNQNATTCFSSNTLLEFGVKQETLDKIQTTTLDPTDCHKIESWIENAYYEFDTSRLRIDISIPQVALQSTARGYVDPSVWDRGINAGFLSYSGSAYKTYNNSNQNNETTNAFMSLTAGINLADWQFRHNGQWRWQDQRDSADDSKSSYDASSTYLQKAFPQYRGVATLGDSFTNGELFDSIGFRGIDFSSDDRMLPNSMQGYAPRVRGIAKTNAKVEVRQQGQLIYQTTVAPGNFEINDLYPTGFGGELEVSIIEANGEVQNFAIPYASVVQMLRPNHSRYSITAGEFRDNEIDDRPVIVQAKYQRGLNNYLTGFTGTQIAENYAALLMGLAFATPIGAISFDITHSEADFEKQNSQSGQSFRLSYSKLITPTNTNLTLAAYRYSTENYYKLRDALLIRDLESKSVNTYAVGKQRSEFQITLNQGLPSGWGNLYMVGSWVDYWNKKESNTQYQFGYSNNYHGLTYGLSAINREIEYDSQTKSRDTEYMMTLSFPIGFSKNSVNVNSTTTQDSRTLGISGTIDDRFSYGSSLSHEDHNNPSFNVNGRYRTNYTTLGGSYSVSDNYQQAMLSTSGNIVAHANGIHFGPEQGQTMVVVYAPEAAGAKVNNTTGLSINNSGYAVIPYVTPYRLNDITLDPQGMSMDVELEETSHRIAPYAGAITKVNFSTKSGKAIYIHAKTATGDSLPFAAQVFNAENEVIGMVAQGSMVYIRTEDQQGEFTVKWGDEVNEKCQISYGVTLPVENEKNDVMMIEAICK